MRSAAAFSCPSLLFLLFFLPMSEALGAGRKAPTLYSNHFMRLEKKAGRPGRYNWKCKYCGDDDKIPGASIGCRDDFLPQYLADSGNRQNAPATVRIDQGSVVADQIVDFAELARIERGEIAGTGEDDIVGEEIAGGCSVRTDNFLSTIISIYAVNRGKNASINLPTLPDSEAILPANLPICPA